MYFQFNHATHIKYYLAPIITFSILYNLPKFLELKVHIPYSSCPASQHFSPAGLINPKLSIPQPEHLADILPGPG